MKSKFVRFLIGPWNFAAGISATFIAVVNNASLLRRTADTGYFQNQNFWLNLIQSITLLFLLYFALRLANVIQRRCQSVRSKVIAYHVTLVLISLLLPVFFAITLHRQFDVLFTNAARLYVALVAINGAIGLTTLRLEISARQAKKAANDLAVQRELMLDSEERTKRDVANYLHDNVQAGLVVAASQLAKVSDSLPAQNQAQVNSIIQELEQIRRFDIRQAGRQLSPDIQVVGLKQSLEELADRYRKSMTVTVSVDAGIEKINTDAALAIYRLSEQALLNAAAHGKATCSEIKVRTSAKNTDQTSITLKIENNGLPVPPDSTNRGTGSAIMDAWVQKFAGSWQVENDPNAGVVFTATLQA